MPTAVVHQALHGYSDGHRLISSSLTLPSAEARRMLVMSDLSGPGVRPGPDGYLTGYPLEGAGKYVLARTWAAPEMPRPGCVWTHSLIIDFADLATLSSADELLSQFRRPEPSGSRSAYAGSLTLSGFDRGSFHLSDMRVGQVANALYAAPEQMILVEADGAVDDERLATAIWMQQWPRLRRAFGFCTLAGVDRSSRGGSLDLQFALVTDRQGRSKFPDAITPDQVEYTSTLTPLFRDLEGPRDGQFREFLRRTGGDVDGGRKAMIPLCRLYSSLFEGHAPDLPAAVAAFATLDGKGRRQARSLRTLVARKAIETIGTVDDNVFDFLVDTLEQDAASKDHIGLRLGSQFGAALWQRSPVWFVRAMSEEGAMGRAVSEALQSIRSDDLVEGLRHDARLAPPIVARRPDLLENAGLWRISGVDERLAEGVDVGSGARVAAALLEAGLIGPASLIIERADAGALAEAIESATADRNALGAWLQVLGQNPNRAAAVLASGHVRQLATVVALARAMDPDQLPNDFGEDPWLIAMRGSTDGLPSADVDYLAAFLMSRALRNRSRSQAELLRFSYTTVHQALQAGRLPYDVERMISWRLDRGGWLDWDKCTRLRQTVVARFVDGDLDPEIFGRLTDDGKLAKALIDDAAGTWRGRRYLVEVHKRLKQAGEKGIRARADYIADKIY